MRLAKAAIFAFGLSAFAASASDAQSVCPEATPISERVIQRLLGESSHAGVRARFALQTVTPSGIRKLSDATDAAVCQRLAGVLASQATAPDAAQHFQPTFYTAGGRYYIVATPRTQAVTRLPSGAFRISLSWIPVYAVDTGFNVIAGIAM